MPGHAKTRRQEHAFQMIKMSLEMEIKTMQKRLDECEHLADNAADVQYFKTVLAQGAAAAQKRAYKILAKVYRKVGFPERERN